MVVVVFFGVVEVVFVVVVEDDVVVEGVVGGVVVVVGVLCGFDWGICRVVVYELGMVVMCKELLMLGILVVVDCL